MRFKLILTSSVLALLATSSAFAEQLLSIDFAGDQLVSIDTANGAVAPVGALGVDANSGVDLAVAGSRLFMLQPGSPPDLYELDPQSGAATFLSTISAPDVGGPGPSPWGEALSSRSGVLVVSYKADPIGLNISNAIADLELDGTLSNSVTYSTSVDLDWMTYDEANSILYGVNSDTPSQILDLSAGAAITNTVSSLTTLEVTSIGIVGLSNAPLGSKNILKFASITDSSPVQIAYDSTYSLSGLAEAPVTSVPALPPVGLLLLVAGLVASASLARRVSSRYLTS